MARVRLLQLILIVAALGLVFSKHDLAAQEPLAFLKQHCVRCHGPKEQKSDRRFDQLTETIDSELALEAWQEVVDQLSLELMPPEDQPQPSSKERAAFIAHATKKIQAAQAAMKGTGRHVVLRRLNAWEYQQTISDLLHLPVDDWNPAENFPAEVKVEGFDNNGEQLVTSGMLLEKYLLSAETAIRRATQFGSRPEKQSWAQKSPFYFQGKGSNGLPKVFLVDRFRYPSDKGYDDLTGRHFRGGHIGFRPLVNVGVPISGRYKIRVKVAAVDRNHPYGHVKALREIESGEPIVMEIAGVDRRGSVTSTGNISSERTLARFELTSEEPQWLEVDCLLDEGFEPEVRYANGPLATKQLIRLLTQAEKEIPEFKPFVGMKAGFEKTHGVLRAYRGPKLRVFEVQIEGPLVEHWPPLSHQALYGDLQLDQLNLKTIKQRLGKFAERAFRRPLVEGELKPIESMVAAKLADGAAPLEAMQLGVQAILCSPAFLYFDHGEARLDDHALATRLSYFLWSSMPDDELLNLASQGRLSEPEVLSKQVLRMLSDSRSQRFVSHFIRRWLDLDNIGEMPPSNDFQEYYRANIEVAMRTETETFFKHILSKNLPVKEFLTADYSFLNRQLAQHYGIESVTGNEFQKVSLASTQRGGLTGQALFLTASANGVDTSPVVRGIYVLEKILGYSPPPPPPDVPAIESDIRGAKTIREQLAKHRSVASCAECHRKIDPLGFALENFDAVGQWREDYGRNLKIDGSGEFPGGDSFKDIQQFRAQLVKRSDQFERCFTEKLLTYSLGRELNVGDRPAVDSVLKELKVKGTGLADLIRMIVLSEPFQNN